MAECNLESYHSKNIQAAFDKGGNEAVRKYIESNLDEWKNATVSIAVTGRSGVGKSTFINAFRNMKDDEDGSAKIGVTETTTEVRSHEDPTNPNIKLFDLPGVGTTQFPQNKYLEMIDVDRFDTFLLMTSSRFTENDKWLAGELKARKKPFYLVRTQVWHNIKNKNRNVYVKIPKEDIIDEIRKDCRDHLQDKTVNIYLIDSYKQKEETLDFMTLRTDVIESLPKRKQEALLYVFEDVTNFSPELIQVKKGVLQKRIWKVALLAGIIELVPIPGVSVAVDAGLIRKERFLFANQLGLTKDGSIYKFATATQSHLSAKTVNSIKSKAEKWDRELSVEEIGYLVSSLVVSSAFKFVPIIGTLFSNVTAYTRTGMILNQLLDDMIEDALEINMLIGKDFGSLK